MGRGIRQGDPLAPYLFILATEVLSWEIQEEVCKGSWKPFRVSRGGAEVSHLFFADDLMIFGEALEHQVRMIMHCIEGFSKRSGLIINLNKSVIFCSPNTCNWTKSRIGEVARIPITEHMDKYLGIPILQNRVSKHTFSYILEKMSNKLTNWKTDSLSLASFRVLTQSALATIPVYTMQAMAIPRSTFDLIDKT